MYHFVRPNGFRKSHRLECRYNLESENFYTIINLIIDKFIALLKLDAF